MTIDQDAETVRTAMAWAKSGFGPKGNAALDRILVRIPKDEDEPVEIRVSTEPVRGVGVDPTPLQARIAELEEGLRRIEAIQPGTLEMLRREGFVFKTPLHLSEGWEKLAFTLYTSICQVDAIARSLVGDTE